MAECRISQSNLYYFRKKTDIFIEKLEKISVFFALKIYLTWLNTHS